ncbi:hypothetical protein [Streptomyces sp. NPDC001816]|uniref:hypothetical protein n=1 Tax=Streptomyces sp. NPDC001816 TaxID=3364612 RepID=UPI0036BF3F5D
MVDSSPGDRTRPALVLQRLDGVPWEILLDINRHAPPPDLAVILTAEPGLIAERIAPALSMTSGPWMYQSRRP